VQADIGKLGNNPLIIPRAYAAFQRFAAAKAFEKEDVEAIQNDVLGVERIAPTVSRQALAVWGNKNWRTSITGTTSVPDVRDYQVSKGRKPSRRRVRPGATDRLD
jgi:putative ABC transport system permease protein